MGVEERKGGMFARPQQILPDGRGQRHDGVHDFCVSLGRGLCRPPWNTNPRCQRSRSHPGSQRSILVSFLVNRFR